MLYATGKLSQAGHFGEKIMPLTKEEQVVFEDMFDDFSDIETNFKDADAALIDKIAQRIYSMTGYVNLNMRLFGISQRLERRKKPK